jgi:hypothetical protein
MCDDAEMKRSKKLLKSATTVVEFMEIWSGFFENKICIPFYGAKFIGASDNPEATIELGKKLKEINMRGFLTIDSQVNVPGNQKGYVSGYIPETMAHYVVSELNRYSGIVAFYSDVKEFGRDVMGLYVTYDAFDDEIVKSAELKKMIGNPFTSLFASESDSLEEIREWMSDKVKKKIKAKKYKFLNVISPCFESPPEFVFDKVLEVLRSI